LRKRRLIAAAVIQLGNHGSSPGGEVIAQAVIHPLGAFSVAEYTVLAQYSQVTGNFWLIDAKDIHQIADTQLTLSVQ
jgi:hypothetical protein